MIATHSKSAKNLSNAWTSEDRRKLRRRLRGDLDNIVLKALRKEPERRYPSVEQLAEDIRRHLQGLPVTATPDTLPYRMRKFMRRHRVGIAAVALVVVAIAGGIVATMREARVAEENRRRAEMRFNDVRKLANSLIFEVHDSVRDLPGSTPARRLIVTRALEYLDSLSQQSQGDASLQKELAAAYERIGDVLGYPYAANLGDVVGALQSHRKALAIRESLAAAHPGDLRLQQDLATNYVKVAQILEANGDFSGALAAVRKASPITEKLAASDPSAIQSDQLAGSYYFTAGLLAKTGNPNEALKNYEHASTIRQAALRTNPRSLLLRTHLAADFAGEAQALQQTGRLDRAVQIQGKAVTILENVSEANRNNATLQEYLAEAVNRMATYRKQQGNLAAALAAYTRAHRIFQNLVNVDSKNSLAKANFGFSDNGIGECLIAEGKPAAAMGCFREAATSFEAMSPRTTGSRYVRTGLAQTYSGMGSAYSALAARADIPAIKKREYWKQARASCEKSLALWNQKEKLGELESGETGEAQKVAECIAKCGTEFEPRPHNSLPSVIDSPGHRLR
jgi:tetratricopeptide (TPR) repeat protein